MTRPKRAHDADAGRARWFEHASRADWTRALADALHETLAGALREGRRAVLVAAGGTTPAPVYEQFAASGFDFSRALVLPSDERCAPAESPLRNDALLARHFAPRGAEVLALVGKTGEPDAREFAATSARIAELRPFDVALLGMGADGHTLSWFPDAQGLRDALSDDGASASSHQAARDHSAAARTANNDARSDGARASNLKDARDDGASGEPAPHRWLARVDAGASVVAAPCPRRVTLTAAALAGTRRVLLAVTGAEKRRVLERALALGADAASATLPVRALLHPSRPLEIHWSA